MWYDMLINDTYTTENWLNCDRFKWFKEIIN
jgi:hypothetical protein